jgi:predicted O-methyltransferase YrrM
MIKTIASLGRQLSAIPFSLEEDDPEPRWLQPWFPPLDGMALYAVLARYEPRLLVEVGSGNSTKFARRAIMDGKLTTKLIAIDPSPRTSVDKIADTVLRKSLENTDLTLFEALAPGDVVFFDGSHRCITNSDVAVFFVDVLPRLRPGVIVGIHDIFWPMDYPPTWTERFYNEQYLLAAYMLGQGDRFPLILSCQYAADQFQQEVSACLTPDLIGKFKKEGKFPINGGSLWFSVPNISLSRVEAYTTNLR